VGDRRRKIKSVVDGRSFREKGGASKALPGWKEIKIERRLSAILVPEGEGIGS